MTITDFRIDLDDGVGVVILFGTCSSNESENDRTMKIKISPIRKFNPNSDRLIVKNLLTSEDNVMYRKAIISVK